MKDAEGPYQGRGLIADPIHQYILYTRPGAIPGEATEQDLIDTSWMQRLRRVPQLQSARWVYPAAEHSRFQHSLGAMHLAGRLAQQLYPSLRSVFPDAPSAALIEGLLHLKRLLSGVFTADNMDYVLRDAYMCGVAIGPIDIDRIIYYSFFSEKGLTLDRAGLQAFTMFLNARFYMYTNVYYHRTTRGIDLHLKEIFRDTMRIAFPYDLRKDLHPYLHLTEWTLLEDVGRWHDDADPDRRRLGAEWRYILDRKLKWRMSSEEVLDQFEARKGQGFLDVETVKRRVRTFLPAALRDLPL